MNTDKCKITCRYDENGNLIFNTNENKIPEEGLNEKNEQAMTIYKKDKQDSNISNFFANTENTPIILALIFLITIIIVTTGLKDIRKYNKQQKEVPPDWVNEYNNEHTEKNHNQTKQTPQIIYIKQKQSRLVTTILVIAALCIILYTLPRLIASGSLIYFFSKYLK